MKKCGQGMKVILTVHGRERTFSEQELIAILEKHFPNEVAEKKNTAKIAKVPTEDHWFEVNPQAINQSLFQKERKDEKQEQTRKLIQEAFQEVEKNPKKYGRKFKTMMPSKTWATKTVKGINQLACKLGDHNADWVEQALEWAQRICNGESWGTVCNNADTANYYRLILWKNGYYRLVGGSLHCCDIIKPPSDVDDYYDYNADDVVFDVVPLVVRKTRNTVHK